MDSPPMKGISLLLGNDVEARTTFPRKRTKLNAANRKDKTTMRVKSGYNLRDKSRDKEMEWFREILSRAQYLARRNLSKPQDKMKKGYNQKPRIRGFQEGDKVSLLSPNRETPLIERLRGHYTTALKKNIRILKYKHPKGGRKPRCATWIEKICWSSEPIYLNNKVRRWRRWERWLERRK